MKIVVAFAVCFLANGTWQFFSVLTNLFICSEFLLFKAVSAGIVSVVEDVITFNAEQDVFFLLYTRENPDGLKIYKNADSINNSTFNKANPVRFIIHGFLNNKYSDVNVDIRKAYLLNGAFNVVSSRAWTWLWMWVNFFNDLQIVVDWGWGAITPDYISARYRINDVSVVLSNLINFLIENGYTTHAQITIVGHSLGEWSNLKVRVSKVNLFTDRWTNRWFNRKEGYRWKDWSYHCTRPSRSFVRLRQARWKSNSYWRVRIYRLLTFTT